MTGRTFNDEAEAWRVLEISGYGQTRGGLIVPPSFAYIPTPDDLAAIRYLCEEWDYDTYEHAHGTA